MFKINSKHIKKNHIIYYNSGFLLTFKITIISLFVGLSVVVRIALYEIPNIELLTFLLMFSVIVFKMDVWFSIINISCLLQILLFGIVDLFYFYVYNFYGFIIFFSRKILFRFWFILIIYMFIFGALFGFLCALQKWAMYGIEYAILYWINGLLFDWIHAIGNSMFTFFFFLPLIKVFIKFAERYNFIFNHSFILKYIN